MAKKTSLANYARHLMATKGRKIKAKGKGLSSGFTVEPARQFAFPQLNPQVQQQLLAHIDTLGAKLGLNPNV